MITYVAMSFLAKNSADTFSSPSFSSFAQISAASDLLPWRKRREACGKKEKLGKVPHNFQNNFAHIYIPNRRVASLLQIPEPFCTRPDVYKVFVKKNITSHLGNKAFLLPSRS